MNIRKADFEDIQKGLLKLYIDGYNYHYNERQDVFKNKDKSELNEDLKNIINNSNISVFENDGKILGYVVYQIKKKYNNIMWVDELVVDKDNQHMGIGKKLMDKIKEITKQENCKRIELCCWSFNQNAREVYRHLGYKEQRVILEMNL